MQRKLLCFIQGHEGAWEGICVDFDIAVAGRNIPEVQESLAKAIRLYVQSALEQDSETKKRLLSRKAPFYVRLSFIIRFFLSGLRNRNSDGIDCTYRMPCPA